MSVLIDISHPAHVHFFRPIAEALIADGVAVHIVARDKDVTVRLLEASGLSFEVLPMSRPGAGRLSGAAELLLRSWALRRRICRHKVKVVLTRNPSGAIAAFGTRATSIFDTDDGRSVGIHYWTARPFADIITSSSFDPESHGRGHRQYRALKAQMFASSQFRSSAAKSRVSESRATPLFVARFSAHTASHDSRVTGLDQSSRSCLLSILKARGDLIVSEEGGPPVLITGQGGSTERARIDPMEFHGWLAEADLVVSDSGSVCAEAALLGTPSIVFGSFVSSRFYIQELKSRGLLQAFSPGLEANFLAEVDDATGKLRTLRSLHRENLDEFERDTVSLLAWYVDLVHSALRESIIRSSRGVISE